MNIKLSKEAQKIMKVGTYVETLPDENAAKVRNDDLFKRENYRSGDGDHNTYVPRPGSLVAFKLPSRGIA